MALILCPECQGNVSSAAQSCPHCGNPITDAPRYRCPHCFSFNLQAGKKGFSGKNAVIGAILVGGVGVLAGTIGKDNVVFSCVDCGKTFDHTKVLHRRH